MNLAKNLRKYFICRFRVRVPKDFKNVILSLKQRDGDALKKILQDHAEAFIRSRLLRIVYTEYKNITY